MYPTVRDLLYAKLLPLKRRNYYGAPDAQTD